MKKLVALILTVTLVLGTFSVFASFPDLEDSRWDWARDEINEMTDKKIIAGYPDGNFGPADGVTKLQSLLLVARILGFYEEEMEPVVAKAEELYAGVIEPYGVSNVSEVAFLMYYGIISENELSDYLGNADEILKRYEAAIILTKAAGAEKEVLSGTVVALKYDDTMDIPSNARRYVNYVTEKGYMVGMTETTFEPNTSVTRAQMAVMLYRIMEDLSITYLTGDFANYDGTSLTLVQSGAHNVFTVSQAKLEIRVDGELSERSAIPVGGYVAIKYFGDTARYLDAFAPVIDDTITGRVSAVSAITKKLTIEPLDGSDAVTVTIDNAAVITLAGSKSNYNEIKKGDTVTVLIQGGVGKTVDIAVRNEVISGASFESVTYEPYATVTFVTSSGEKQTKALSTDVSVARNNKLIELRELMPGDTVTITLENGVVTKIKAISSKTDAEGVIEEIHLSSSPYIVVRSNGDSKRYNIANDIQVLFDETTGTIYDLRIGALVKMEIEGETVRTISSSTPEATGTTIIGVIESINLDYNFFFVTVADSAGGTQRIQVFTKKTGGTRFIDSTDGSYITLEKVKEGSTAIVTGSQQLDGSFVATAVVVTLPSK